MCNKLSIARHILYLFRNSLYFADSFDLISTFYNTMLVPFWDPKLYYKYSCDIFQIILLLKILTIIFLIELFHKCDDRYGKYSISEHYLCVLYREVLTMFTSTRPH